MSFALFLLILVAYVAYANGANDNFKGVATLLGSGTTSYRGALLYGTAATFAGSLAALALSRGLVATFSGAGLVPDALVGSPGFVAVVAAGAGTTVLLATWLSLPVSTTHALTGALVGAGLVLAGRDLQLGALGSHFVLPLVASPIMAVALTAGLYPLLRRARLRMGVERTTCVCVGETWVPATTLASGEATGSCAMDIGVCEERYQGTVMSVDAQQALNGAHFFSAGAVSFARGLNDTPKIVALLVAGRILGLRGSLLMVGLAMAAGALLQARKVATTMSAGITAMNHGQGATANLVTAGLVIVASRFGLPVSTTHVTCGSLFGLGAVTGQARTDTIRRIIMAWVLTLPLAASLAAGGAVLL